VRFGTHRSLFPKPYTPFPKFFFLSFLVPPAMMISLVGWLCDIFLSGVFFFVAPPLFLIRPKFEIVFFVVLCFLLLSSSYTYFRKELLSNTTSASKRCPPDWFFPFLKRVPLSPQKTAGGEGPSHRKTSAHGPGATPPSNWLSPDCSFPPQGVWRFFLRV